MDHKKSDETTNNGEDYIYAITLAQASTYGGNVGLVEGLQRN
jgi:hypothetical protein